jgi:hypothetical protein
VKRFREQYGMTVIGWIVTLALVAFGVLFVLRLVPIYVEAFKVQNALESMAMDSSITEDSRETILRKFANRMSIEDVDRFDTEAKAKEYLTIEKRDGGIKIRVDYRAVAPLVSNLSLVADWQKEVSLP